LCPFGPRLGKFGPFLPFGHRHLAAGDRIYLTVNCKKDWARNGSMEPKGLTAATDSGCRGWIIRWDQTLTNLRCFADW
jgi:hypothetical protein